MEGALGFAVLIFVFAVFMGDAEDTAKGADIKDWLPMSSEEPKRGKVIRK